MRTSQAPPAPRSGVPGEDSVGTEPSQLARPRCPAPAGAVAPGAGGQRRVVADGGSWRRQSGGRDNGGIVRWRRWHSSARLGTARRRTPCQQRALPCAAGAECGHGAVPGVSVGAGSCIGWAGAALSRSRGCSGGLCQAVQPSPRWERAVSGGSELLARDPRGVVGPAREAGRYVWLQKKMGTGGNDDHSVASAAVLPTLAHGPHCGGCGETHAGRTQLFARAMQSISSSGAWRPPVPPRQPRGTVAPMAQGERAGWQIPGRSGRALGSLHGAGRAEEAQGRRKGGRGQA